MRLAADAAERLLRLTPSAGRVEWTDKLQTRCLVYWRRPAEWAKELHRWVRCSPSSCCTAADKLTASPLRRQVKEHGLEDSVTTFHELSTGDDTKGAGECDGSPHLLVNLRRTWTRLPWHGRGAFEADCAVIGGGWACEVRGCSAFPISAIASHLPSLFRRVFKGASSDDEGVKFFGTASATSA